MSVAQKIAEIEEEMARTQKNKATAKHLGLLKAKLAKLRTELLIGGKSGGGGGGDGFDVAKSGDTRIGFVGFPSVGKSTLLTKLTGTFSEAASYEFTTLVATPGQLHYKGAKIQMIDLPGIIEGAKDGKGRGRQVIATARTCNMLYIVLDASKPMTHKKIIEKELYGFNIRLNAKPPGMLVRKKDKGGIAFTNTMSEKPRNLDLETVTAILREYKIHNCDVVLREDCTPDQLIDVLEGNIVYMPCIYVLNKIDAITMEELELLSQVPHYVPISAKDEWNFDELLETTWSMLNMIRIYTKPKGQIPDLSAPVILHQKNPTVEAFCMRLHRTLAKEFKHARVWGNSVRHQPQIVGLSHVLQDEDVVQIIKKV
ncbi:Developmentally-regulated GTP-binding protein 1 [Hondaea fermentalgiana]|uniref:Developmentally-regulated GTP-binding protein 1 n=1 Tax=Hondaea fermentalgiana TaxID=2315210 RepID=A0A2R5GCI6_9STRA|nr:Developmentally-regulated GTP-binding protein 1 [Hondaea fermentalgiana]|eukprot:GBG28690.1 Developmentally-regulated GTP-binding protein 1 [Hondaea fermentalgiana]